MADPKVDLILPPFRCPVRVVGAVTADDGGDLHTVCQGSELESHPAVRVRSSLTCAVCNKAASSHYGFPKGRDNGDGTFTIPSAADLAGLTAPADVVKTITLMSSLRSEVDKHAVFHGKQYHLAVGEGRGQEQYGLIRDVIRNTGDQWAFWTVWAYRSVGNPIRVMLAGDVLTIQQFAWPAQVKMVPNVAVPPYDERLLPMAMQAAELTRVPFNLDTLVDTRALRRRELLDGAVTTAGAETTPVSAAADDMIAEVNAFLAANAPKVQTAKAPRKRPAKKAVQEVQA